MIFTRKLNFSNLTTRLGLCKSYYRLDQVKFRSINLSKYYNNNNNNNNNDRKNQYYNSRLDSEPNQNFERTSRRGTSRNFSTSNSEPSSSYKNLDQTKEQLQKQQNFGSDPRSTKLIGNLRRIDKSFITKGIDLLSKFRKMTIMKERKSYRIEPDRIPKSYGNFDRVIEPFSLDSASIRVAKWKSRETGLTLVWADVEGPLVHGYFTVATEIFNDSGVPHTLEHLIFLGSEKYPYKGILDSLANRAFARGTNAWTDTTHTAYTVTTAGSDGFLRLLPIYLDHILYATITSEGFTTEVYHINGKGEDAGVVYSEMQGRENGSGDLMALRNQRLLYPPSSGYRSETGGLMEALRVLSVEQIRDYHSSYYRPHNLQLIVSGSVDPKELLRVLQEDVEPSIIKHGQDKVPEGWKRPFLESSSKGGAELTQSQTVEVEFPEKDESIGEAQISWVGPDTNDHFGQTVLEILTTYLTDSAVSPLSKRFTEIDCPLCTEIYFSPTDAEKAIWTVYLSSVPVQNLSTITEDFKKALVEESEKIDMDRLKMVIERSALKITNQMEVDAHDSLSAVIISNFLYGNGEDLISGLSEEMKRYRAVASWSEAQWSAEFKKWFVERPSLSVLGRPSASLANKLEADTKKRIETTREKYGEEGLKKLEEKLEKAQKVNETPYPNKFLSDFPVPSLESIQWIDVQLARGDKSLETELQKKIDEKDSAVVPYFLQFNHVESNFFSIHVNLSPLNCPLEHFGLIPVYLNSFFSLPIRLEDGNVLGYEEVVHKLDTQTVEYDINIGTPLTQTIDVYIRVEKSKYEVAIEWLKNLLWGSIFDVKRLQITTAKAIQNIPSRKRDGSDVCTALYEETLFSSDTAPASSINLFRQEDNLPRILEDLKVDPESVLKKMESLRSHLLKPENMKISVGGNILRLDEPKSAWLKNFKDLKCIDFEKPLLGKEVLTPEGERPSGSAIVISIPSIESSYAYHMAKGPQGFDHPDQAALSVAISVLNGMESYLWKAIRGTGLAYGASMGFNPETGHVYLNIYRSPDSYKAFDEARKVLEDLISGKLEFDQLILESAKSSSAYSVANKVSTAPAAAYRAFIDVALKGVSLNSSRELLERSKDVTRDEVIRSIKDYLLPIFDPISSSVVVSSSTTKSRIIYDSLKLVGYRVEIRELNVDDLCSDDDGSFSSSD